MQYGFMQLGKIHKNVRNEILIQLKTYFILIGEKGEICNNISFMRHCGVEKKFKVFTL